MSAVTGQSGHNAMNAQRSRPSVVIDPDVASRLLFSLDGIDLANSVLNREQIAQINPHRGDMALLDGIVWQAPDRSRGVAVAHVRGDEFWVSGHFPQRPMLPGVIQIEMGAQLACFLYNSRKPNRTLAAFLRIEEASFRSMVSPGDVLYILCEDVRFGRRQFICNVQGMVGGDRIAFDARIRGMQMDEIELTSPDRV